MKETDLKRRDFVRTVTVSGLQFDSTIRHVSGNAARKNDTVRVGVIATR